MTADSGPKPAGNIIKDRVTQRLRDVVRQKIGESQARENLVFWHRGLEPGDVALHLFPEDHDVRSLFRALDLDEKQPHHWRGLLDGLASLFVEQRGSKSQFDAIEQFELALAIDQVWRTVFQRNRWRPYQVANHLRSAPDYRQKWGNESPKAFPMRISRLAKSLGGMDEQFRARAIEKYANEDTDNRFVFPDLDEL